MKEILYYANKADDWYGTPLLNEMYEAVDYSTNPIEWIRYAKDIECREPKDFINPM